MASGIHRFKYAGRKSLGGAFSHLLRYAWGQYKEIQNAQLLIPVPLHPHQCRQRGYNQAEVLAERLGPLIARPVIPVLRRRRKTASQTGLDRSHRAQNVSGAFEIDPLIRPAMPTLRNRPVLLVDDVCTTASTLTACARSLRRAGLGPVHALVLARDL